MMLNTILSRSLAVTILAVLVIAVLSIGVMPVASKYNQDRTLVRTSARQIAQFEAIISHGPEVDQRLREMKSATGQAVQLLEGDSNAIVGAALQDRVRKAISEASGGQRSAQMLPPQEVAEQVQIGVKVVATVQASRLIDLLNDLETGSPTILLGNISIRTNVRSSRLGNASPDSVDPELTLGFTAYGFAQDPSAYQQEVPADE